MGVGKYNLYLPGFDSAREFLIQGYRIYSPTMGYQPKP
jgi:hypothetical protein